MTSNNANITFFGFALADSMFSSDCAIVRTAIDHEEVKRMAENGELTPCLNPSHAATIAAMRERFGIEVEIPETPPKVVLSQGDSIVVMGVRGAAKANRSSRVFSRGDKCGDICLC